MTPRAVIVACAAIVAFVALPCGAQQLDDFSNVAEWRASGSDDVQAKVSQGDAPASLRLDYDFRGRAGYAVARRAMSAPVPEHFEIALRLRESGPANDVQIKFVDASGDNVWWYRLPAVRDRGEWTTVRIRRRHVEFAWGPTEEKTFRAFAAVEFAVVASAGGTGRIEVSDLTLRELPAPPTAWPRPRSSASSHLRDYLPAAAIDGDAATAWRARVPRRGDVTWTLDLGADREFGGVSLRWESSRVAHDYDVSLSTDGRDWQTVHRIRDATSRFHPLAIPEADARYVRLRLLRGDRAYGLAEFTLEPLSFGATTNAWLQRAAQESRRGAFPRPWLGEQGYWTIVGADGGPDEGMLSEDGAFELRRAGPSLEPFLVVDGKPADWANVAVTHSLRDGYLPMPAVAWARDDWRLSISAFVSGGSDDGFAVVRYEFANASARDRDVELRIALRPLQVNAPQQFLNGSGGAADVRRLDWNGRTLEIEGRGWNGGIAHHRIVALDPPDTFEIAPFAGLLQDARPGTRIDDARGLASGAFVYHRKVAAGATAMLTFLVPWSGASPLDAAPIAALADATAARWHDALDRVTLRGPAAMQPIADTIRTALAHILINRDRARLQPGSRSYERAWIRDGALESLALLRLGHADVARSFLDWYRGFQFETGKIPCCVDDRGADPVPENDSPGEFLWLVAELDRYTHDRAALDRAWPNVSRAVAYLDELRRSERTPANQTDERRAFYGLLPASISHEGYSAKPMHSYWDVSWGLAGYDAAIYLARTRGDAEALRRWTQSRDEFGADVQASLREAIARHRIDYLPGAAELGDLDPTSTTVAVAPLGIAPRLPAKELRNTFERYWKDFSARRAAPKPGQIYTPYEIRNVGAFVHLGWRERALELLDYFMKDRRPPEWNQWAEVVSLEPRAARFIGDMPHGWVASDFIRSALDLFAYERLDDESIVLAAGVDPEWLDGDGIAVERLRSPWGELSYSLRRESPGVYRIMLDGTAAPPGGFLLALDGVERRLDSRKQRIELGATR